MSLTSPKEAVAECFCFLLAKLCRVSCLEQERSTPIRLYLEQQQQQV